jgi:serine protease Do
VRAGVSILALGILIGSAATALGQDNPVYAVKGVVLGTRVNPDSKAYEDYDCNPSEQFEGFTWCTKKENEKGKRGPFKAYYSILHSRDGTVVYVNRFQEPAFWGENEVKNDIDYYSRKLGGQPTKIINMPTRARFPNGTIATWGDVVLERVVDPHALSILSAGKSPKIGVLIDFLGNYETSAKNDLPVYRITGHPGFVWAASSGSNGRGTLRFLAINPSAFYPPQVAGPKTPSSTQSPPQQQGDTKYSDVGWWSIIYRKAGNLQGCMASSKFRDETLLQLALIQSSSDHKEWAIFLSNSKWNSWISKKAEHKVQFQSTEGWWGTLSADKFNVLSVYGLSAKFIKTIADADDLTILNERSDRLTELDMKDSEAALNATVKCLAEHPYTSVPEQHEPPSAPAPQQESVSSGSGFFVAPHFIVTNNHVVKECTRLIWVRYPEGESVQAMIYRQDDTNDLSLLHTELASPSVASFRFKPRVGEQVAAYGFPFFGLLSSSGNFTLGYVTAPTGMNDDTRFFQISTPIQPGNSGGPLLDMNGKVVGMVTAQLNPSLSQNVNFGIRSPIITNFLTVKGVTPKVSASDAADRHDLSAADVADTARDFTVQVFCGVPVLRDTVKCDMRYQDLKLPVSEYESFKRKCMGEKYSGQ